MSEPPICRILLVEDDEDDYMLTSFTLSKCTAFKTKLDWKSDPRSALDLMKANQHDVYIVDFFLGPMTGIELFQTGRKEGWRGPAILLFGYADDMLFTKARNLGVSVCLDKNHITPSALTNAILSVWPAGRLSAPPEISD